MNQQSWRVIFSPPCDGAANMAVDEAILQEVAGGRAPATLRFYAWTPPCLSLGMAQRHAEVDRARLEARGWDLVRRPTGGRAILHTDELTYSVIAPQDEPRVAGSVVESYRRLSGGLARGLQLLGLQIAEANPADAGRKGSGPICFEVPSHYEITAGGKKLVGSAQARRLGVVLQHGTLPLVGDLSRIVEALAFEEGTDAREVARARTLARATTLEQALGRAVTWEEAARAMAQGFAEALDLPLEPGDLTGAEREAAARLRAEKYAAPAWTLRR